MKNILKLEELAMLVLSIYMFSLVDVAWWWYLALFFVPDVSFIGYAVNIKVGAFFYNLLHHKGLCIVLYLVGIYLNNTSLQLVGIVFFGHSAFDRMLGYGLKYTDSFNNTHLGIIGKQND